MLKWSTRLPYIRPSQFESSQFCAIFRMYENYDDYVYIWFGPVVAFFLYFNFFVNFTIQRQRLVPIQSNYEKEHTWFVWDSHPGPQVGRHRWSYGAMEAHCSNGFNFSLFVRKWWKLCFVWLIWLGYAPGAAGWKAQMKQRCFRLKWTAFSLAWKWRKLCFCVWK